MNLLRSVVAFACWLGVRMILFCAAAYVFFLGIWFIGEQGLSELAEDRVHTTLVVVLGVLFAVQLVRFLFGVFGGLKYGLMSGRDDAES